MELVLLILLDMSSQSNCTFWRMYPSSMGDRPGGLQAPSNVRHAARRVLAHVTSFYRDAIPWQMTLSPTQRKNCCHI